MKVVCGLGNPGAEYAYTRHNVAWWLLDEALARWNFPAFRREGIVRRSAGRLAAQDVWLLKPLTYVNRSGAALAPLQQLPDFVIAHDLLVVVDDVALDVGRVRLRGQGSSGGHNGLKSVEAALRTREYARLRIGVGGAPDGVDLADWVLSPFPEAEENQVRELIPDLVEVLRVWVERGVEAAARAGNR
jgi:PTH1 family peptidyl-tRNA hydrolase